MTKRKTSDEIKPGDFMNFGYHTHKGNIQPTPLLSIPVIADHSKKAIEAIYTLGFILEDINASLPSEDWHGDCTNTIQEWTTRLRRDIELLESLAHFGE